MSEDEPLIIAKIRHGWQGVSYEDLEDCPVLAAVIPEEHHRCMYLWVRTPLWGQWSCRTHDIGGPMERPA